MKEFFSPAADARASRRSICRLFFVACLFGGLAHASPTVAQRAPDACVNPASVHHGVNADILRAILAVESRFKPDTVTTNTNGSIDVGIAGINSIHFPELQKHGIRSSDLLDPCIGTYVAAWKLRKKMVRWGNNWFGVAAYHSETPRYNARYQALLFNQLVTQGVVNARRIPVPKLAQLN